MTSGRFLLLFFFIALPLCRILADGGNNLMHVDDDIYAAYDRATDYLANKKMLAVADSLERIAKAKKDNRILILANKLRASYYYNTQDSVHAVATYSKLYKLIDETPGAEEEYYDVASGDIRMLYEHSPSEALSRAKDMLKRGTERKSAYGMYQAYATLGSLFYWRGDCKLAIENSKKAIELSSRTVDAKNIAYIYCDMALCYVELRQYGEALLNIRKACELEPGYIFYHFAHCWTLFKSGDKAEFLRAYKEIRRSPDYENLSELDRSTLECYALSAQGRSAEALALLDDANTDCYSDTRMEVLLAMGNYKDAFKEQLKITHEADSIREQMEIEEMSYMDAQTNNGQLRIEAEELKMRQTVIVAVAAVALIFVALVFAIVMVVRHKKHIKAMERKNAELEHANNVKSVFLKNLTHEVNTPLNHISGFAQLLACRDIKHDEESMHEMADGICSGANQLKDLFDNIIEATDKLSTLEELEKAQSILQTMRSEGEIKL